jgi:hypothetical protein
MTRNWLLLASAIAVLGMGAAYQELQAEPNEPLVKVYCISAGGSVLYTTEPVSPNSGVIKDFARLCRGLTIQGHVLVQPVR